MTDSGLIRHLSGLGVKLWVEGDALKFSAPRGVLSDDLKDRLRARKDALRDLLRKAPHPRDTEAIPRLPPGGVTSLSFAQERLWFLHQLDPSDPSYNVPFMIPLQGPVAPRVVERALREVARRHEVLRTTYELRGEQPFAVVHEEREVELPRVSLAALSRAEQDAAARRLMRAELRRPFDLASGPVLRAWLFVFDDQDQVLFGVIHHIATDGWSSLLLSRELSTLLPAFSEGRPSPLAELPIQYASYAAWQRRRLSGAALDERLAFWKRRLGDAPRTLDLPTSRPRSAVRSHEGGLVSFALDADTSRAVEELARREGATLFMTLFAAYAVLLFRFSGQDDFVVGTPIAGRTRPETEPLLGFFVNTLALRVRLSDTLGFRELLASVREELLAAEEHQDLPFERIVQELSPERDLSRTPLFQVMFALQSATPSPARAPARLRGLGLDTGTSKFDLTLTLVEGPHGLAGALEHATDLFDAAAARQMAASFAALLAGVAAHPGAAVGELPVLSADARRRALDASLPATRHEVSACLHELFEARVERAPDAPAAIFGHETLSYGELDARANQVAHALRRLGVGPGRLVGLHVERSLEMLIGLLGILKAGGAYLPLDPEYPEERLAFMIEDSGASVVVAGPLASARAPSLSLRVGEVTGEPASRVSSGVRPGDLAYAIYTSGSTGKPKGTLLEHRNVVRLFTSTEAWFGFGAQDVWTMFHSFAFDFSVWEVWGALLYGGRVVVVPYWVSRSPESFHQLLVEERVTSLSQTPSAFRQLVPAEARSLRHVVFGGEALDLGDLRPFWERHGDETPRLVNMYGITETSVHVTYRPLSRADLERPWSSVIGRPLPDLGLYILDAHLEPVPVGVPGEIYVGGAGVGRGYLDRPELTAERFLADPFQPFGRLYKTGDLARRLPSGDVEYLGRLDHQVKLRGFRVELGEIEAALTQHPAVRKAVVLAREDLPGDKRLVAYLVAGLAVSAPELRSFLRQRLPEHMVPAAFVPLDALPLTENGKLDRKALPAPELGHHERVHVAPRGPIEEALAGIFAEVLHVPQVGAHDGFFELGGHSLLATQAMARIRAALDTTLPLRALFEAPSPAELARAVEQARRAGQPAPPILRAPRDLPLPLSFGQERLWMIDQIEPDDPSYVVPETIRLRGPLDTGALERALQEIVRRHEVLRTTYEAHEGRPVQVVHEHLDVRLPVEDGASSIAAEASRPFDLKSGPVLRARLYAVAEDEHVLLLSMHHIACDAWSLDLLARELDLLYEALCAGRSSPLAELPVQYADYAAWQRSWFSGDVEAAHLAYWRGQLEGAATMELPTDRLRTDARSPRGARRPFLLSKELSSALRELSRRTGVTLFMTLLAAFDLLLHRLTGQDDLSVGTPVANRGHPEIEQLIGFFLNTLVLRVRPSGEMSFRELLGQVREVCLDAYAHQDMPFERLVQELHPERDLQRTPLFQVLFTMLPSSTSTSTSASASTTGAVDVPTAKFDLTLALRETADGIAGSVEYAADIFDATTIARLIERLQTVLAGVIRSPEARLCELPVLPDAELRRVLHEWNATSFAHPLDAPLHEIFSAQAARAPDAVALTFEDAAMSYGELDARSGRLAWTLRGQGVGPEVLVAVRMERSLELFTALYGVLKAGGAYVPLDPEHPEERLAFMLDDARPAVVLTHLPESSTSTGTSGAPMLDNLVYVIYTSGSTGRPKGAMNTHRGVLNRLLWAQHAYRIEPGDRVLHKTPVTFDVSVWEIFWPLMFGARVVIARPGGHREPAYLASMVAGEGITIMHFVSSMLGVFLDEVAARRGVARSLRRVVCSGEALSPALARRTSAILPGVELANLYGPTEASVEVTAWDVPPDPAVVFIGHPVHNTAIYLLDEHHQPVAIGARGELFIGGVQVGRGYCRRPELTAERFVCDPFSVEPGARMYRTGDVARWSPDGAIEYLGRTDHQVKIRGFRVELGEIDTALLSHPALREAVAVARDDRGGARIVAYVAPRAEAPTAGELRAFVRERLPEAMVPSAFVVLEVLPLTPSGKLDRRALPAPDEDNQAALGQTHAAPETPVEQELTRIWTSLLRRRKIGVHDNFFELGGDSILGIQMVARAAQAGIALTPRQIFVHPTIAELAAVAGAREAPLAEQGPVTGEVMATPILAWWLEQGFADPHHHNQALMVEVNERLDPALLEEVIAALVTHHDALRMRLRGGRFVIVPPGEPVPVRRVDARNDRSIIGEVAREVQASLDLSAGPILRVVLFALGPASGRLLLVVHHLAVDGVTWRILLEDLWTAYRQRASGAPIQLRPKTTSFQRWAERLTEHARSTELEAERASWRSPARASAGRVPRDHQRGDNSEASARHVTRSLSSDETEALLQRVPEAYRTQINDVLLTALAQTLGAWTGAEATLLDLEGHGREEIFAEVDLTRTAGWFTSLFPVVLEVRQDAGPGKALMSVKEQLRAIPGHGLGYGVLRYLRADPELASQPPAEVVFNYLGQMGDGAGVGSVGPMRSLAARRPYVLEVTASVGGGRLHVQWTFSESLHDKETVEGLAQGYLDALRAIIEHCVSQEAGGATPSDFGKASLTQEALDMLAALDPDRDGS